MPNISLRERSIILNPIIAFVIPYGVFNLLLNHNNRAFQLHCDSVICLKCTAGLAL